MTENRAFKLLPKRLQNDFNKKQMSVSEDLLFEPEDFAYVDGQIGDENSITARERARIPFIRQADEDRQKTQLSTAAVYTDANGDVQGAAFYDDLVGHIDANGGNVTNKSNLFECDYYSFNPPIDIDKWTNFQKYYWTGVGTAVQSGEYVTKDAEGSQVIFHRVENDGTFTPVECRIHVSGTKPTLGNTTDDLIEDLTTNARNVYRWTGSAWELVAFTAFSEMPTSASGMVAGKYIYVARAGSLYQRPVLMHYSATAGRYVSKTPVISLAEPESPVTGMIWEDCRVVNQRRLNIWTDGQWTELTYQKTNSFSSVSIPASGYYYDARRKSEITDEWSANNWWVHFEDLSVVDRNRYSLDKASRPILSFWQSIEIYNTDKTVRNQSPRFNVYMFNGTTLSDSYDDFSGNTIIDYDATQRRPDVVLDRLVSYDETGELLFKLTLEDDIYTRSSIPVVGYKFFKDTYTGKFHYIWTKATTPLQFDENETNVPLNLSNNPNHELAVDISRRVVIEHYRSILQNNSTGLPLGSNSYRWTDRNPVNGAVIIDTEGSLLLNMITLMDDKFDIPNAIRSMSSEYTKFMKRFQRKLDQFWEDGANVHPTGTLKTLTVDQALDAILSQIFVNVGTGRPFNQSKMGTFLHTTYDKQVPIMIPASAARIGAIAPYQPAAITNRSGDFILCHDGALVPAKGDQRDSVVLALENRFFQQIPVQRRTETLSLSSLLNKNYFSLHRFVGNKSFIVERHINAISDDYTTIVSPASNYTVWSRKHGMVAVYEDTKWTTIQVSIGAQFLNLADEKLYVFNGFALFELDPYNREFDFDYSSNEFNGVIRRSFEKWYTDKGLNPSTISYTENDSWTWNYGASGIEGHWQGIYRRVYRTDRPSQRPWEILGYSIKPSWWETIYPNTGGKWPSTDPMWDDLSTGTLALAGGVNLEPWQLLPTDVPPPVDTSGDLLNPIEIGLISIDILNSKNSDWLYGDGGPVETDFLYSHEGRFALALSAYLLKPARFVEYLWSDYSFSIGDPTTVFGGEVMVNDDTYKRRNISNVRVHGEEATYSDSGLNSWISEQLVISGFTPKTLATVIKNAKVVLGWQVNGFVEKSATTLKTSSGIEIPYEDVDVFLHKSQPFSTLFHSGVNIIKKGSTYQIFGYDFTRPFFTTLKSVEATIGGMTEQEQAFIATEGQSVFTLTDFKVARLNDLSTISVLVAGYKVPPAQVTVTNSTAITLVDYAVTAGQTVRVIAETFISASPYAAKTFRIAEKPFTYFDQPTNKIAEYGYGYEFEGPGEVVQFFSDYQNYLASRGFVFEGDDWIAVAKRFALWTQTAQNRSVFADVPDVGAIKLNVPFGFVDDFKKGQYGGFNILDITGRPIEDFQTYKFESELTVKSETPIYGIRVVLKNYQHAVFLSNRTKFNDLIYDSFSGLRQKRLFVNTLKTKTWVGRLSAPGYIIGDNTMIPNLEKSVKDISKLYNTIDPTTDVSKLDQSLALYNWFFKDYMREMNISRNLSFDYHKHMIREKGTRRSMVAFAKAKANTTGLEIKECWAWKLGDFGPERVDTAEIYLRDADFKKKLQTFVFGGTAAGTDVLIGDYSDDASRWAIKPKGENFAFTARDTDDIILTVNEKGTVRDRLVHYDPVNGFFDPIAVSQIDIKSAYDPAYYHVGSKVYDGYEWGADQVGTLWWDISKLEFEDYHSTALTLEQSAEKWGELKKFEILSVAEEGDEYVVTFRNAHNFQRGDITTIMLDVGYKKYRAYISEVENAQQVRIILINDLMDTMLAPENDHLRFKYMRRADIEVFEWIESTVPPFDFVMNTQRQIKYGAVQTYSTSKKGNKTLYHFWVRNGTIPAKGKKLSVVDIENRLKNPSAALISWFGVKGTDKLIMDTSSFTTKDDLTLHISVEPANFENNSQWAIVPEEDHIRLVPDYMVNKLIDSLTLQTEFGRTLPYFDDAYGSGHGQVIFRDTAKAKTLFLATLNEVFSTIYRRDITNFSRVLPTADYWSLVDYDLLGYTPPQQVVTMTQLNQIDDAREGDTVYVQNARSENSVYYGESYQWTNGAWVMMQAENGAVSFNDGVFPVLRTLLPALLNAIDAAKANYIIFMMMDEMLIQNPDCDWYFKTSLIDVRNFVDNTNYAVNPLNDTASIYKNLLDVKPFRTKIRELLTTHNIYSDNFTYDTAEVQIEEKVEQKITLFFDRLSCNTFDDLTYDTVPFDTTPFDMALWDREFLATRDWATFHTFTAQDTTIYSGPVSREFLNYRLMSYNSNGDNVPTPIYTIRFDNNEKITIEFGAKPPVGYVFNLQRSSGTATTGLTEGYQIDETFETISSTYEHAAAVVRPRLSGHHNTRTVSANGASQLSGCSNIDQADGGNSAERVRAEIRDSVVITITTSRSEDFGGYDLQPFDTLPWDIPVAASADVVTTMTIDGTPSDLPSTESFVTHTSTTITTSNNNTRIFRAPHGRYTITAVEITTTTGTRILTENEYKVLSNSAVKLKIYLLVDDVVTLYYGKFKLQSNQIRITAPWTKNYSIENGIYIVYDALPQKNQTLTVSYVSTVAE